MNLFNSIKVPKLRRNVFNLSHEFKFSGSFGNLMPILCQEVVPGDTFRVNTETFVRMSPMLAPLMHRINVYVHFFFVPNRLIWSEWEDFITGGEDGKLSPVAPFFDFDIGEFSEYFDKYLYPGSLADFLGIPVPNELNSSRYVFSSLPVRAYWRIMRDYYCDENLDDAFNNVLFDDFDEWYKLSGSEDEGFYSLLGKMFNRAWEKDYFTSALPWAQRGEPVTLPMTGDANVVYDPDGVTVFKGSGVSGSQWVGSVNGTVGTMNDVSGAGFQPANIDNSANLKVDLSNVNSATINELRRAVKAQEWLEKSALGGSRYIEQILAHFGVRSSDARLQRAQYLGGGVSPLRVSEVLQTSSTEGQPSPLGDMGGHAYSVGNTNRFKRFFEEHGFVMGIMSILPRSSYQQGLPRMFSRQDKFDYFWPEFAHIGEQEVKNKEIYYPVDGNNSVGEETFGYQSRYAEYKTAQSRVAGAFRDTLNFWHAGRVFAGRPTLDSSFVHCSPEQMKRLFATQNLGVNEQFYVNVLNNIRAKRPMPRFGTPSF
ncbi:MAG: hypothetical protein HPZ82_06535 [Coprobacter sp.]|nr:hypothetical protein [Coprobacter sp.]